MSINEYLEKHCDGNKSKFGRIFGRRPGHICKLFNEPEKWLVIVHEETHILVQVRAKSRLQY